MKKKPSGVDIHIATPTLDKMMTVKDESQKIGNFIEWLQAEHIVLAKYQKVRGYREELLLPEHFTTEKLLARYFGIDLEEAERERCKILAGIRVAA